MKEIPYERSVYMNHHLLTSLNELLNDDIMSDTDTSELEYMINRKKVLSIHKSSITEPKSKSSRWQTYVKNEEGLDRKISATSEERLYQKLYNHYFVNLVPTIGEYFDTWIDKRISENISHKSILRFRCYWTKYYLSHPIINKKLNRVSSRDIEDFYHSTIKLLNITKKELVNMKFPLKDMMKLAKSNSIISMNPFLEAEISTLGCAPPNKHQYESRIYLDHEKDLMFQALNEEIRLFPDCTDMHGIFFLFTKGVRIAELAAIKMSDIDFATKQIYIHRMETVLADENGDNYISVVDYGKKHSPYAIRWLDLTDSEIELLREVIAVNKENQYSDVNFLFVDDVGRTKVREFDYRIRKMCKKIGIIPKSAHDIRRTVASQLYADGLSIDHIREYLGHSDIETTRSYIYDLKSKEMKRKMLTQSLSNMNGLKRTKIP